MKQAPKNADPEVLASVAVDVISQLAVKPWRFKICEGCGAICDTGVSKCVCGAYRFDGDPKVVLEAGETFAKGSPQLLFLFNQIRAVIVDRAKTTFKNN